MRVGLIRWAFQLDTQMGIKNDCHRNLAIPHNQFVSLPQTNSVAVSADYIDISRTDQTLDGSSCE